MECYNSKFFSVLFPDPGLKCMKRVIFIFLNIVVGLQCAAL